MERKIPSVVEAGEGRSEVMGSTKVISEVTIFEPDGAIEP